MKEKIAFIVESTKLAHRTFIHLSENHKDKEIYIISMKVIGLYEFSYPRDLKLTDFPYCRIQNGKKVTWQTPWFSRSMMIHWRVREILFLRYLEKLWKRALKKALFFGYELRDNFFTGIF